MKALYIPFIVLYTKEFSLLIISSSMSSFIPEPSIATKNISFDGCVYQAMKDGKTLLDLYE